ncbi:YbhB/YbcL family Raf kinase inhibitor-like protein [Hydrogenimonas sp.]
MRGFFATTVWAVLAASWLLAGGLTLKSPDFHGRMAPAQVFDGYGCRGGNLSPALSWHGEPAGTKSFAVTLYDPDAPTGSGWWHWVVYDIPASVHALPEGAGSPGGKGLPEGARQARNDYGFVGYGGACPPPGDRPHRYILTLYALDVEKLPVPEGASPAMVGYMLQRHALAKASLMAYYGR